MTFEDGGAGDHRVVIGVVENTADATLWDRATPTVYLPAGASARLIVRVKTKTDAEQSIAMIRRAAASLDPGVPILSIETIDNRRREALQLERLLAVTSTVVAWVARDGDGNADPVTIVVALCNYCSGGATASPLRKKSGRPLETLGKPCYLP